MLHPILMRTPPPWTRFLLLPLAAVLTSQLIAEDAKPKAKKPEEVKKAIIPEDLVGDEHVREEFGVNEFTTPSIRRLFEMMDGLGSLSYDSLKRPVNDKVPSDRVSVSLRLGTLIADGFLVVQCEKVEEMQGIGRAMLKMAKGLGAGNRVNKHTQSLLEHSIKGNWGDLRAELARTQADVEAEMVQLRDTDIAHLISLGGWIRAFDISTQAVAENYSEEKSRHLARRDIVEYYMINLETLHPDIQKREPVSTLMEAMRALLPLVDVPEGKSMTPEEVKTLHENAALLEEIVSESTK